MFTLLGTIVDSTVVEVCPEQIGVIQAQVASMAAESLLTTPGGIKKELDLVWGVCPFPTHLRPDHCSKVQCPDNFFFTRPPHKNGLFELIFDHLIVAGQYL